MKWPGEMDLVVLQAELAACFLLCCPTASLLEDWIEHTERQIGPSWKQLVAGGIQLPQARRP
jgi:hypothetical protein